METMSQAIAQFKNELTELQNTPSALTGYKMQDGRELRKVNENTYEVTTYKGRPATQDEIAKEVAQLLIVFPKMTDGFLAILMQDIVEDKWTIERVRDAVKEIKRKQNYPTFTIGDFMGYDKPMRLYNHGGYCWLLDHGYQDKDSCGEKSDFGKIMIDGKCFFYLKKDLPKK